MLRGISEVGGPGDRARSSRHRSPRRSGRCVSRRSRRPSADRCGGAKGPAGGPGQAGCSSGHGAGGVGIVDPQAPPTPDGRRPNRSAAGPGQVCSVGSSLVRCSRRRGRWSLVRRFRRPPRRSTALRRCWLPLRFMRDGSDLAECHTSLAAGDPLARSGAEGHAPLSCASARWPVRGRKSTVNLPGYCTDVSLDEGSQRCPKERI